jgi:hypothetical protein
MITAVSADGTDVRAFDEGSGPVILVVHPGNDDGTSWQKVAAAMPHAERVLLARRDHSAHLTAPGEVAHVIEDLASRVLS